MATTSKRLAHELLYFDGPGRAEAIRICLHMAGIAFTDTRFSYAAWKASIKATTPLGAVPVLTIDGVAHTQSTALLRYAGTLAGWYPTGDPLQALVVDEAMDSLNELTSKAPQEKEPAARKAAREEFQATVMVQYATRLELMLAAVGATTGFGATPTIADLVLHGTVKGVESGSWDYIDAKFFDAYPLIQKTVAAVDENEQVKAYYASKKE
jgi:glutathione S-transferase